MRCLLASSAANAARASAGGLRALVPLAAARTLLRLRAVVAREDAEGHRDARLEARELEPARRLGGDVLEVRRVAADDAAERDHGRVAPSLREGHRSEWKLERSGHGHHVDALARDTRLGKGREGALEEPGRDVAVETTDDDADVPASAVRRALVDADAVGDAKLAGRVLDAGLRHSASGSS